MSRRRRTRKAQAAKKATPLGAQSGPAVAGDGSPATKPVRTTGIELLRENVAGSPILTGTALRALPQTLDDVTREVGSDTYERMLNDPEVSSDVLLLKYFVLADGVQVGP